MAAPNRLNCIAAASRSAGATGRSGRRTSRIVAATSSIAAGEYDRLNTAHSKKKTYPSGSRSRNHRGAGKYASSSRAVTVAVIPWRTCIAQGPPPRASTQRNKRCQPAGWPSSRVTASMAPRVSGSVPTNQACHSSRHITCPAIRRPRMRAYRSVNGIAQRQSPVALGRARSDVADRRRTLEIKGEMRGIESGRIAGCRRRSVARVVDSRRRRTLRSGHVPRGA